MKIQIKNRWNGNVLFEVEADSIKLAVKAALEADANLIGADLIGADLTDANLTGAIVRLSKKVVAAAVVSYLR